MADLVDNPTRRPCGAPIATWRVQRMVLLRRGAGAAVQRASTDGFEPAFDGMVGEL
jgi:hypothetical protein